MCCKFNGNWWSTIPGQRITSPFQHTFDPSQMLSYEAGNINSARITLSASDLGLNEAEILLNNTVISTVPQIPSDVIQTINFNIPEQHLSLIDKNSTNTLRIQAKNSRYYSK